MRERPKRAVSKTVAPQGAQGSNPCPAAVLVALCACSKAPPGVVFPAGLLCTPWLSAACELGASLADERA